MADRAGAALAGRVLADELERPEALGSRPEVDVGGVPFLTQAFQGRYRDIRLRARDVDGGDVQLSALDARLTGARVPLRSVLSGDVASVPVDLVEASALVPYDELGRREGDRRLTVTPDGDRVRLEGEVRVLGQDVSASAVSRLGVDDGDIVVEADSFDVGNETVGDVLGPALRAVFDQRIALDALPYGLVVDAIDVRQEGVAVRASAPDAVLTTPAG